MTPSNCPTCSAKITDMDYKVSFIIVDDDTRYRTHGEWDLSCGHHINDDLVEFHCQSGFAELIDKVSGKHLIGWKQPHPIV